MTLLAASWLMTRVAGRGRVAVADDDDVLAHRVLDPVQALHGHLQRRVEVGHVAGRHAVDGAEHAVSPGADRPQGEEPRFLVLPVEQPGVVVAREGLDGGLGRPGPASSFPRGSRWRA